MEVVLDHATATLSSAVAFADAWVSHILSLWLDPVYGAREREEW
jgi:hypothetical protein